MSEAMLAIMLGGWEIVLILGALFLLPVLALLVLLVVWTVKRKGKVSPPPLIPAQTVKLDRTCPKCGSTLRPDVPEGLCPACLLQHGIATEAGGDQPPFIPPELHELAKLFPQLEIIGTIGKGGMGAVYKARQPALDRFVALKILAPKPGNELDFGSRFSREAKALARLNHPNIVAVYDFGQIGGLSYFLMEYVDGPNLRQVQQAGKLSPKEALEIIPQICAALQFAHDEGIVHRDIKPENVLLDRKGRVKIADFGLAKILGQEPKDFRLTGARDVMGTPHYMAPEQVEKPQEVDHRADIYSLGVVFYEMLTGELPLGKFAPPSHKVQVDVRLDEVVLRALEKEPERRYQQANEFKTRVETVASTGGADPSSQPDSAKARAASPAAATRADARLSKAAVGGACWIPFVFMAAAFVAFTGPRVQFVNYSPIAAAALSISLCGIFGATVLGWIAVSNIRHSAGRLWGMGLAVFDGLLFPLLLLNALLLGVALFVALEINRLGISSTIPGATSLPPWAHAGFLFLVPATVVAVIVLDVMIVKRVWLLVTDTPPGTKPAAIWNRLAIGTVIAVGALLAGGALWGFAHNQFARPSHSPSEAQQAEGMSTPQTGSDLPTDIQNSAGHPAPQLNLPTVSLIAVEYFTNKVRHFWQPDGSPLAEPIRNVLNRAPTIGGQQDYVLSIVVSNAPDVSLLKHWLGNVGRHDLFQFAQVAPSPELGGTLIRARFSADSLETASELRTLDVQFGIPVNTWQLMRTWEGPSLRLRDSDPRFAGISRYIELRSFSNKVFHIFDFEAGQFRRRTSSGTEIWMDLPQKSLEQSRWALDVEQIDGKVQNVSMFGPVYNSADVWTGTTLWDVEVPRDRIRKVALRGLFAEDYHWTEFRDVVFKPFPADPAGASDQQTPASQTKDVLRSIVANGAPSLRNQAVAAGPVRTQPPRLLEFRWALSATQTNEVADEFRDPHDRSGRAKLRLRRNVLIDETGLAGARAVEESGGYGVMVLLNEDGQRQFAMQTSNNIGRQLAIVWKGSVLSAPVVRTAIPGPVLRIAGEFPQTIAEELAASLNQSCGNTNASVPPAFGQVVRRTLFARNDSQRETFDFDSGKAHSISEELLGNGRELQQWVMLTVADAILDTSAQVRGFIVPEVSQRGGSFVRVPDSEWNSATLDSLQEMDFNRSHINRGRLELVAIGVNAVATDRAISKTFAFQTREAGLGILQFLDVSDGQQGYVRFQYRLLGKADSREPAPAAAPIQVPRRTIEYLIRKAPVQTGTRFELWDTTSGRPHLRRDITRLPLVITPDTNPSRPMQGEVLWLRNDRRFYVQWDSTGITNLHYYGPFTGDPAAVLAQPPPSPEEVARDLTARLDAAKHIMAFPERDRALASIAQDAAVEGNAMIVRRVVGQITAFTTRDEAICAAVRTLAANGQRTEALEIARTITAFPKRDDMLRELAK